MECRLGCGACCIAPSISSSIPGMENGKPAGERCINLSENNLCLIFKNSNRPLVCSSLKPSFEMCGTNQKEALTFLLDLEIKTKP